jgi:Ca2+-binding RTX toxin-like protein
MAIRTVGPNSTYPTITAAMVSPSTGPGDEIQLENGYSNETATILYAGITVFGNVSSTGIVLQLATGVPTFTLTGSAPITILDAGDGNGIVGNAGDNLIQVRGGVDAVDGGLGQDRLIVDYSLATGAVTGDSLSHFSEAGGGARMVTVTANTIENFSVLTGSGADTITTHAGDDYISTGSGAGTVSAGQGRNTILGGADADTITALDGGNFVDAGDGTNTITTGGGADTILSGTGADTIMSGAGNDFTTVRGGADSVTAGAGTDTLVVDYSTMATNVNGGITGGNLGTGYVGSIADLVGSVVDFRDVENFIVTTGSGNDSVQTGAGNDILNGGRGSDVLDGGAGDDLIGGGSENDQLLGGLGNDTLQGDDGNDTLVGADGNDFLFGGNGADILDGGLGNDVYYNVDLTDTITNESGGVDTLITSDAALVQMFSGNGAIENVIFQGSDSFTYTGSVLDNLVQGGSGADVIDGGLGNDVLAGGAGNDRLVGNVGNDAISGEGGNDLLFGSAGDDGLDGGVGDDQLFGDEGNDALQGADGNDAILGGSGDDLLVGGNGSDLLNGDQGRDTLFGGAGDDQLFGGASDDVLTGGQGNDTFVFNNQNGFDIVLDFSDGTAGNEDVLLFAGGVFTDASQVLAASSQVIGEADGVGNDVRIDLGNGNQVLLLNTAFSSLDASDFLFV